MLIIPEHIILKTMQEVIDRYLIPKFNELGMNATGEWLNNVKPASEPNKGIIKGRSYTEQLVYGRKPGRRPPIEPLERWVTAKFGIGSDQARGMAFAIANKIANEGTTWYQKGGSDLLEALEQPEVIEFVNSQIGDYLSSQVQLEIVRDLKEVFS